MKKLSTAILLLLLAGAILRAAFFLVSVHNIPPAMDECITALQSKQIIEPKQTPAQRAKLYPWPLLGRFPMLFMTQPYLFPTDSYLNAFFIGWTPRNAFGIRLMPFVVGLIGVALSLLVLLRLGRSSDVWPGAALVLVPSTYVLMLQAGYTPPSYVSFLLGCAAITWLCLKARSERWLALWAGLTGLAAGATVTTQMIAAPLAVGAFAVYALRKKIWKALIASVCFTGGFLLGLAPLHLGKVLYPGAHQAVSGTLPWQEAIQRLWAPTLSYTLPTAMGLPATIFPDNENLLALYPGLDQIIPILWLAIMVYASFLALSRFIARARTDRDVSLTIWDMLILVSWMTIFMFALSARAFSESFRYLLPAVWAFPFVVAFCFQNSRGNVRQSVGVVSVLLVILNASTSIAMMFVWSSFGFARDIPRIYDLEPAVEYLQSREINRCYANYFDTYRINYMTDEDIICSQHYNVRFYGWQLPYKEVVDEATNVAFVLGKSWRFLPSDFDRDLHAMGVTCKRTPCGDAMVYTDFHFEPPRPEHPVPQDRLTATTTHQPDYAFLLTDGDRGRRWGSRQTQDTNMFIAVRLQDPLPVCRVNLFYNYYAHDQAERCTIKALTDAGWVTLVDSVPKEIEAFVFVNGHPVYGDQAQTFRFEPVRTDTLRIEVAEANPARDWTVGEVELYSVEPVEAEQTE